MHIKGHQGTQVIQSLGLQSQTFSNNLAHTFFNGVLYVKVQLAID